MCFWLVLLCVKAHFLTSLCVKIVGRYLRDSVVLFSYEFFKSVIAYLFGSLLEISEKTAWVVVQCLLFYSFQKSFFSLFQKSEELLLLFVQVLLRLDKLCPHPF